MKTLILNGSPRKNGDTVSLIKKLTDILDGEHKIINAYFSNISPCIDCRYCWRNNGCSIDDEMSEIYDYIKECDNIIMASPVYFSQPTGKLLDVCSRFQRYYTLKEFQGVAPEIKPKKGAIILVGGGDGQPESAYSTLKTIMQHINVTDIFRLTGSFNTNNVSAEDDNTALIGINEIAKFMNK